MFLKSLTLAVAVLGPSFALSQAVNTIYVSPNGNDSAEGTMEAPLRSANGALEKVRSMRLTGSTGQFVIEFADGTYRFTESMRVDVGDSGTYGVPLVFRGASKDVFFDGSVSVNGWQLVTGSAAERLKPEVRPKVFEVNVPPMDLGEMNTRGYPFDTTQTWSTLVFNGESMTLARYPNEGWLKTRLTSNNEQTAIMMTDPAPFSWQNTGDVWAYGFFGWDWADTYQRVASFDPINNVVNLTDVPFYGLKGNQRFFLVNALEAIDMPGEYYIDRQNGKLYFYCPLDGYSDAQKIASLNAGASLTSVPTCLVETYGASDVSFENITFQNGRGSGAWVRHGSRVAFKGCTFRRFEYTAMVIGSGTDHTVLSSDFYDLGEGGIVIFGGERDLLKRSGHLIENCYFRDYAKTCRSYRPAIDLWGVGHRVSRCRIEDAPHSGIVLHGNNNIIEYTDFARLCKDTNDSGAIYIGRNPTFQGNKIWYNTFTDLWTEQSGNYSNFVTAIYLDDMASGTDISMNIFDNVQIGTIIGGGRDNKLTNNYFFDSGKAVSVDARGTTWASDFMTAWNVPAMLSEVPYKGKTWKRAYAKLPNYLKDKPELPKRNTVTYSVHVGSLDWLELNDGIKLSSRTSSGPLYGARNSVTTDDPGFADMANENYWFPKNSPLGKLKIKEIDPDLIGLYYDQFRLEIPPPGRWANSGNNSESSVDSKGDATDSRADQEDDADADGKFEPPVKHGVRKTIG